MLITTDVQTKHVNVRIKRIVLDLHDVIVDSKKVALALNMNMFSLKENNRDLPANIKIL